MATCSTVEVCTPGCEGCAVVGSLVQPRLHLRDSAGEPIDATVAASLRLPNGTVVVPAVAHDALGEFHFDYQPLDPGQFFYRFTASGSATDAVSGAFLVGSDPTAAL